MTYSVLPFPVIEPTLHGLGFPGQFQGLDQLWKSRTKTNLQAKYRTPECHWQPAAGIFKGFKIHITKNFTRRLGRVQGKKNTCTKSMVSHTTMTKKTHQNELDGWKRGKHDG